MRAAETIAGLAAFEQRGAGTDAERRAAGWLAQQAGGKRREARIEPFWCRPNWALAHAWHALLGIVGSLVSVGSPRIGGALLLLALLSLIADEVTGVSLGRRLTLERASQNVVSTAREVKTRDSAEPAAVRLILTAHYNAGRTGLAYRRVVRTPIARLRLRLGRASPGWLGWLAIILVWLLATAILRTTGDHDSLLGAIQLVPTVGLVLALALLIELGSARYGPAASDNASGVGVVLALAAALDVAPPPRMSVELLLQGAGDGTGIGLRRHLRAHRREYNAGNTVVLGIAACGAGEPRWWVSDGQLVPLLYLDRLRALCAAVAAEDPELKVAGYRGRGATPALIARAARLPAISIGCLDELGLAPRSHLAEDTPANIDPGALDATLQVGLLLVDAIAAFLRERDVGPAR